MKPTVPRGYRRRSPRRHAMMAAAFAQSDAIRIEYLDGRTDENLSSALNASAKANFDRFESHTGVVAGQKRVEDARGRAFAPATPNFRAQSKIIGVAGT